MAEFYQSSVQDEQSRVRIITQLDKFQKVDCFGLRPKDLKVSVQKTLLCKIQVEKFRIF